MPIKKAEQWERHPAISLRAWKGGIERTFTFTDEGKDVDVEHGLTYLYLVKDEKDLLCELWIAPKSPLAIGLSPHVPLKGKTFKITKTTGKAQSDTRYTAEEVK